MPRYPTEHGFVLISAIWLLLLGGAVTALLMLRAMTLTRDIAAETGRFGAERSDADAVEAIAADLVFRGPASPWARLPATGPLTIADQQVMATAAAEDSLPDINRADPRALDAALQDRGYSSAERSALIGRILARRTSGPAIASYAELVALTAGIVRVGQEDCILDAASPFGGSAAGLMTLSTGPVRVGSVIRIAVSQGVERSITAIRLITANDRPYAVLDIYDESCSNGFGSPA